MFDFNTRKQNDSLMRALNAGYNHEEYKKLAKEQGVAPIGLEAAIRSNVLLFAQNFAETGATDGVLAVTRDEVAPPTKLAKYLHIIRDMTQRDVELEIQEGAPCYSYGDPCLIMDLRLLHQTNDASHVAHTYIFA